MRRLFLRNRGLSAYFILDKIESCRFMRGISTSEGNLK